MVVVRDQTKAAWMDAMLVAMWVDLLVSKKAVMKVVWKVGLLVE